MKNRDAVAVVVVAIITVAMMDRITNKLLEEDGVVTPDKGDWTATISVCESVCVCVFWFKLCFKTYLISLLFQ